MQIFILTPDAAERSYYEEQVLSPDKKHSGTDILIADKAPPQSRNFKFQISNLKSFQ